MSNATKGLLRVYGNYGFGFKAQRQWSKRQGQHLTRNTNDPDRMANGKRIPKGSR